MQHRCLQVPLPVEWAAKNLKMSMISFYPAGGHHCPVQTAPSKLGGTWLERRPRTLHCAYINQYVISGEKRCDSEPGKCIAQPASQVPFGSGLIIIYTCCTSKQSHLQAIVLDGTFFVAHVEGLVANSRLFVRNGLVDGKHYSE